jgi:hypothetical protein
MDRRADIPHGNEYARDSGFANIKSTASHRPSLFHSENGHVELRIDLIPLISPPVYRWLVLFGAGHRTRGYFSRPADDMLELSLNCSENRTNPLAS